MAVVSEDGIWWQQTWRTDQQAGTLGVLASLQERSTDIPRGQAISACGIGFGGQFDFEQQRALRSVHVPGWEGHELSQWAEEAFGMPAVADNDANLGALGEVHFGAGRGFQSVVYLTISTGIGGAYICGGQLQRGAHGLANEFGHLTLKPGGPQCGCGLHGCAERLLSGQWLHHEHQRSAKELFEDPGFLGSYAADLALLLQQITMVLDPEVFILGGGIGASTPVLAGQAQNYLANQLSTWKRPVPRVQVAELGGNSVIFGAFQLARERYGESR